MDPAGIRTTYLVLYAGHFKPQARVGCGQKKKNNNNFWFRKTVKPGLLTEPGGTSFISYFIFTDLKLIQKSDLNII